MTGVFGIISKSDEELLPILFFSKVALKYIKRRLEAFGYSVFYKKYKESNGKSRLKYT